MAVEIERRFLVVGDQWRALVETSHRVVQGYLLNAKEKSVRVRIIDQSAWLTIKGGTDVLHRLEFEYGIPIDDARQMIQAFCDGKVIEKTRHLIRQGNLTWEVDEFAGDNEGLIIAEIELPSPETPVDLPSWVGPEVSDDPRYLNARLLLHPWKKWNTDAKRLRQ